MASSNPYRRNKLEQILGIDNPNIIPQSDDVSIRSYQHYGRGRKDSYATENVSPLTRDSDAVSLSKRSIHSTDGDAGSFTTSAYTTKSPVEEDNPFNDELDDELDEYPPRSPLQRRRTMPDKAARLAGVDENDPAWLAAKHAGSQSSMRAQNRDIPESPDSNAIPLKAQKMLGISKRGRVPSESEYRGDHALSPSTEAIAPKAQKMLGIQDNAFGRPNLGGDRRQQRGDDLDGRRAGQRRPKEMMNDFKRRLMSSERDYMSPSNYVPKFKREGRDGGSTTDISSMTNSSFQSSQLSQTEGLTETPRSSNEATPRPSIITNPMDMPYRPPSPASFDEPSTPASRNKPLPPPPEEEEHREEIWDSHEDGPPEVQTFELAGSSPPPILQTPVVPNPQKRRLLQQTRHAAARAMQQRPPVETQPAKDDPPPNSFAPIELPAEPVENRFIQAFEGPGSQFEPIELPAKEATPSDSRHNSFLPYPHPLAQAQVKSPPAVPPPRRGGSNRNTIMWQQGVPELAEKTPGATDRRDGPNRSPNMRNSFAPDPPGASARMGPAPPASREISAQRIDRFSSVLRSPGSSSEHIGASPPSTPNNTKHGASVHDLPPQSGPPPTGKLPSTPPSRRRNSSETDRNKPRSSEDSARSGASGHSSSSSSGRDHSQERSHPPLSPTTPRGSVVPKQDASPARLPKLHTQINEGESFTEQLVSALSPESHQMYQHQSMSPDDTISLLSQTTSPVRKPSLPSLAMSLASDPSHFATERRPSRQEMASLQQAVHDDNKTANQKIDMLADLGILQREVDALRRAFAREEQEEFERGADEHGYTHPRRSSSDSSEEGEDRTDPPSPATPTVAHHPTKAVTPEPLATNRRTPSPFYDPPDAHPGVEWNPSRAAGARSPSPDAHLDPDERRESVSSRYSDSDDSDDVIKQRRLTARRIQA